MYKILLFQCQKQRCFSKSLPLIFGFFYFCIHFMLDPGPNPVPEPESECITVAVSLRQKVAVPVLASFPQHCRKCQPWVISREPLIIKILYALCTCQFCIHMEKYMHDKISVFRAALSRFSQESQEAIKYSIHRTSCMGRIDQKPNSKSELQISCAANM